MKKITLLLFLVSSIVFSQGDKFEISDKSPNFPTQYIVIKTENMTIETAYNLVLEWINVTYNSPDDVIKSRLENKYIRINGYTDNLYSHTGLGMTFYAEAKYKINFAFKDGKVKFEIQDLEIYSEPSQYSSGGWYNVTYSKETYTNKKGKIKEKQKEWLDKKFEYFNGLSFSLKQYLKNPIKEQISNEDW